MIMALSRLRHAAIFRAPSLFRARLLSPSSTLRSLSSSSEVLNHIPEVTSLRPIQFPMFNGVHHNSSKLPSGVRYFSSAGKKYIISNTLHHLFGFILCLLYLINHQFFSVSF
nr:dihydrolipoyllysine-residue acetyltransferase component 1 of pyruvate dehydrogenase complex, mitochondrial isoform X1 [Ipomoea batatas]GMD52721.1 dihydrolipoyllysine-residue acetyltransferase component 1 of pyruvate dehydrogenase complex, mitochondrial isoform X1 [Ipomoea batatas]GMD54455.1 dihydrolipoyllysine-residue acetyltransferase component 1 of pyruvate dehydrogenase complex, mitochondrial isoform X1 [Ipomoea batatas]GMD57262.1 dihydrolipoyllysine-residue acetyltransferase component 1 o